MERVADLLFELASVERLNILFLVRSEPLRYSQIAKKLNMTNAETSRHLDRLTSANLIARNGKGEYCLTGYAETLEAFIPFLSFLTANQEYVRNHNLRVLPPGFFERLGDLAGASYIVGVYNIMDTFFQSAKNSKERIWILVDQPFDQGRAVNMQKASEGLDVRRIYPKSSCQQELLRFPTTINFHLRGMEKVPVALGVYDDLARISFPGLDGKVDNSIRLLLQTPRAHKWAEELFLYYWNQAEKLPYEFTPPDQESGFPPKQRQRKS